MSAWARVKTRLHVRSLTGRSFLRSGVILALLSFRRSRKLKLNRGSRIISMKINRILTLALAVGMMISAVFVGDAVSSNAPFSAIGQTTTVTRTSRGVAHRTYRGGRWVVRRTWNGSKWVTRRVWVSSKWTVRKGKKGTRWTTHKTKVKTKSIFHKTRKAVT